MSCFSEPLSSLVTEREMPYVPYGMRQQYQVQPTFPSTIPAQTLPTGIPTGPPYGGAPLITPAPVTPSAAQPPQIVQSPYYTAGYLRRYIGRDVRVEFLVGSSGPLIDRIGTLLEVGVSYIVIRPIRSNDTLICDLYSIKFVTVYG